MMEGAGVPRKGCNLPGRSAASRFRAACRRGLRVFGGFFAGAVGFFVLTFIPFKRLDGPMELPLPVWIMLLPTLVSLGAGVIAGLVVMAVDLKRGRPPRQD